MGTKAPRHRSLAGRAALALTLLIGFYLLAFGICGALGYLCWLDSQSSRMHPQLWIAAVVTIGVVGWSVWPRKLEFGDPGLRLVREQHPKLWSLVEQTARQAGQEPPQEIFLVNDINAFVSERGSRLGFGGTRVLGIGLPLLSVLTVPQLRSVIAHEFGHFHGGDTRLGPLLYRTREAIGRTIHNFRAAESLLHKPFEWYGKLFLRVTHGISRAQEFAADALSVQLVGLEPMQTALRRVNEVAPLYEHYVDQEYLPMLNRGLRPPLTDGFQQFLRSQAIKSLQLRIGEEAMQAKGNPYDTHPPLSLRLAAAAAVAAPGAATAVGPSALELLDDVAAAERDLLVFLTGRDEVAKLPAAGWEQCGPSLSREWRRLVAARAAKLPSVRVGELLRCATELETFGLALDEALPLDQRRGAGTWFLGVLLADALVQAGWRLETGPGDPITVVRGDARLEPHHITRLVADGKLDAPTWTATCTRHGIQDLVLASP